MTAIPTDIALVAQGTVPNLGRTSSETGTSGLERPVGNDPALTISPKRAASIVTVLVGINLNSSFANGLLTVAIPRISTDLDIPDNLQLWPLAAYNLTSGALLLLSGSLADILGVRLVNLTGCLLSGAFILASGLSQTTGQMIAFRAFGGVACALIVPSSVSILSTSIPSGRLRNMGFGCLGFAGPLGILLGSVLGGIFTDGPGWRTGFYIAAAATLALLVVGFFAIPAIVTPNPDHTPIPRRLAGEVDWIGALIATAALSMLCYALAELAGQTSAATRPGVLTPLVLSIVLLPVFGLWMRHQDKKGRPALISNSTWTDTSFRTICIMVLISLAYISVIQVFSSLFWQNIQGVTALEASIRLLPNLVFGMALNLMTGIFIHRLSAYWAVMVACVLSAVSPILMAINGESWSYWDVAFLAQLLSPLLCDVLFTVGILYISDVFPPQKQAFAGAVFNTCAQLGVSIGLCIGKLVSAISSQQASPSSPKSHSALARGYRTTFWTVFAWSGAACFLGAYGLRKVGKIGVKRE